MAREGFSKETLKFIDENIRPIVEFFQIESDENSDRSFLDLSRDDTSILRSHLRGAKGIYSFYNSEYELIYLGKTKSCLWTEMKVAYNRKMSDYKRFQVYHPSGTYKATSGGVRSLQRKQMYVYDCASFFSAYRVESKPLIDVLELMMIRMCPNDILNVRMEGNHTLEPFWVT